MESHHGQRSREPKVSIIIPTRDKYQLLLACIESIQSKTTYENYEIVIIDNASSESSTVEYLQLLASTGIRVLKYPHEFNYSKIINYGVANTESEYLCFLNNDTEVIEPSWLGVLMDHAIQPKVGVVGSKLLYPDGSIQHFGVALGYTGAAGHPLAGDMPEQTVGISDVNSCFEVSAVTFACAVTSRETFNQTLGLREVFKVGLNDVDFALRLSTNGKKNILCGKSCLFHHESKSRKEMSSFSGALRASLEVMRFLKLYPKKALRDQYFLP
jgi:GT2 family glycosyltransferase